jgi:hypothetical protein
MKKSAATVAYDSILLMQAAGLASAKESVVELVVVRADPRRHTLDAASDSLSFIVLPVTGGCHVMARRPEAGRG